MVIDIERQTIATKRMDVVGLATLVDKALLDTRAGKKQYNKTGFSPSNLVYGSGTCARRWFFEFTRGSERDSSVGLEPKSIANMEAGIAAHSRIQKIFESTGIVKEIERPINTLGSTTGFPPVRAFVDMIINWQDKDVVIEIKTANQESYVSKKGKQIATGYHKAQLLLYMYILKIDDGAILYENKNTLDWMIIPVKMNIEHKQLVEKIIQWMVDVYEMITDGILPSRGYNVERSPVCRACPFIEICKEEGEGTKMTTLKIPK